VPAKRLEGALVLQLSLWTFALNGDPTESFVMIFLLVVDQVVKETIDVRTW
jgi:hypothetical protein